MSKLLTLGSLNLLDSEGTELTAVLSQPKRCALLVYLGAAPPGTLHRRDTLLTLFWPERDEVRARNALSQSLSFLRRNLPEGVIRARGLEEVGVSEELMTVDVPEFRALIAGRRWADALELYRGDFLRGFHVGEAWGFEEWMELERERLREAAAGAAWSLATQQIQRGALVEAERTGQRAMDLVCTDESPVQTFIEALARAGDRAAALNFYHRFSARLREKLELDPSPGIQELAQEIRNGEVPGSSAAAEGVRVNPTAGTYQAETGRSEPVESIAGDRGGNGVDLGPGSQPLRNARRWGLPFLAASAIIWASLWLWKGSLEIPESRPPGLIAVAPFANRTGDPSFDIWGDLIANRVEDRLARSSIGAVLSGVRVNPLLRSAAPNEDPIRILSRDLAATMVLTGSLGLRGDSLQIEASCVDAASGEILTTVEPVRGLPGEIETLIPVIQDRLVAALAFHLDPADWHQATSSPPLRHDAYQEYRRGIDLLVSAETWGEAADHFLRAWALDSTYLDAGILAYIKLDEATQLGQGDRRAERDSVLALLGRYQDQMTRAQRSQLEIARLTFSLDLEGALREARAAAEYFPLEMAYSLGHKALFLNRAEEGLEAFRRWDKGDGEFLEGFVRGWPYYFSQYGEALHRLGRHEEELEIILEGRRRNPGHSDLMYSELVARIGLGQTQEVLKLIPQVRREGGGNQTRLVVRELVAHGLDAVARQVLEEEVRRFETDSYYSGEPGVVQKATVLHYMGRDEESHAMFLEDAEANPDNPWRLAWVGITAPLVGDTALAWEVDHRLSEWPRDGWRAYNFPFVRAQIRANLGDRDGAVRLLEQTYFEEGRLFFFDDHTMFDLLPLRGFPPFDELTGPKG